MPFCALLKCADSEDSFIQVTVDAPTPCVTQVWPIVLALGSAKRPHLLKALEAATLPVWCCWSSSRSVHPTGDPAVVNSSWEWKPCDETGGENSPPTGYLLFILVKRRCHEQEEACQDAPRHNLCTCTAVESVLQLSATSPPPAALHSRAESSAKNFGEFTGIQRAFADQTTSLLCTFQISSLA